MNACLFPFSSIRRALFSLIVLLALVGSIFSGMASICLATQKDEAERLLSLSLEDLMELEVTSAFRKPQSLKEIPAAVYVVTSEDIRRSGASSIPEILRMVPGVNVAKIDNGNWAVSIRGFNGVFADKLLVLMDGRTLYSPLFSGTFWDVQDTVLEDIDRIEVIRGPGASCWGSNAVNGVINIITKDARSTKGGLLTVGGGSLEKGFGTARYGFDIGELGAVRFYAKAQKIGDQKDMKGNDAWDDREMVRAGFRSDLEFLDSDFTLQGDIYTGQGTSKINMFNIVYTDRDSMEPDIPVSGGNILARLVHTTDAGHELRFRFYYDRASRKYDRIGAEDRDTIDLEFRHRFDLLGFNEFSWGGSYRHTWDELKFCSCTKVGFFDPKKRKDDFFSFFVQNEAGFLDDSLRLLLGVRFDSSTYSSLDIEPTARLLYEIDPRQSVWLSVSKATRSPSRYNHDARWVIGATRVPGYPMPAIYAYIGDDSFDSEKLLALESGYRVSFSKSLSVDLSLFANFYDHLFTGKHTSPVFHYGYLLIPIKPENDGKGETYGLEITGNYKPKDWWRLELSYSYMDYHYWIDDNHRDDSGLSADYMVTPRHMVSFRSNLDLTETLEIDLWLRYIGNISYYDIPDYTGLDIRLGWHPVKGLELSVVGKDLLDPHHPEYIDNFLHIQQTEIPRSVYGKVTWHF